MHAADPDMLPPPRRPLRRRAGAVRAARVLVQQLDWLNWPVVWWGGSPPAGAARADAGPVDATPAAATSPTPVGDTSAAIAARLSRRPCGGYAVRIVAAAGELDSTDLDTLLRSTAPTVSEVLPVDDSLVARSLRRLLKSRDFPRVLPQVVGDVDAWRAATEAALKRVRPVMLPRKPTPAEVLAIECTCVWLGSDAVRPSTSLEATSLITLAGDVGAPAFARGAAVALGQRKLAVTVPPALRAYYRCGRAFAAWPLDVVALAADAVGPEALSAAAAACPALGTPAGAAFVCEALLTSGAAGVRCAVANYPHFVRLIDPLCDEPLRRLGRLAAAQRDVVAAAVAESGVVGPVVWPEHTAPPERWVAARLFQYAHADAIERILSGEPAADRVTNQRRRRTPPPAPPGRRKTQLQHVLGAERLWDHFFGTGAPEVPALTRAVERALCDPAATFDKLPALAAKVLWDAGEPPLRRLTARLHALLWALATRLDVDPATGWHEPAGAWVAACTDRCALGPGADVHAQAAFTPLLVLCGRAAADRPGALEALRVLTAAAPAVTVNWSGAWSAAWWSGAMAFLRSILECCRSLTRARAVSPGEHAPSLLAEFVRRGWIPIVNAVAARQPQRLALVLCWLRRLDEDDPPFALANAAVLMDAATVDAVLEAVAPLQTTLRAEASRLVLYFIMPRVPTNQIAVPSRTGCDVVSMAIAKRERFLRAVPTVLASLQEFAGASGSEGERLSEWEYCASIIFAWHDLGYGEPVSLFTSLSRACLAPGSIFPESVLNHHLQENVATLVSISAGDAERLLSLHRIPLHLDYQQLDQLLATWRWMEPTPALRELFSRLACDPRNAARAMKLLARLGLCLRLHGTAELHDRLAALASQRDRPADLSAALAAQGIDAALVRDVGRLCALRGGAVPRQVAAAAHRPALLAAELTALEASPAPDDPRQRRRVENLRRYLADPEAMRRWVKADLRKLLDKSLADAVLDAGEKVAEKIILSHVTAVVGGPPPAAYDKRNWDNALRLYFTAEHNRGTLRRLLRAEAAGDRRWLREHPANRGFLAKVAARGVDVAVWTGPFERSFETPAGRWTVSLETDPLHVLQMGNYFETCLSVADGCNAFATIANACEADKRVVYVRDARGVVIGRKLLLMTAAGRIVGFRSYGAGALDDWEGGEAAGAAKPGAWIKIVLDVFSRDFADHCRANCTR